jgi:3-oxoacyl-[acyl-carrier protein] reductase
VARVSGALVIGGSGGIGSAISAMLRDRGTLVGVTYRSTPVEWERSWQLDLTDASACRTVVEAATESLDGLQTLV